MTDPAFIICSMLLLLFSIYIGFAIGSALAKRIETRGAFWRASIGCVAAAVIAFAVLGELPLLYSAVVGLMAGSLAGLKIGFGSAGGPWRSVERFFSAGRPRRGRSRGGSGAGERGSSNASETEAASDHDLISVPGERRADAAPTPGSSHKRRKKR